MTLASLSPSELGPGSSVAPRVVNLSPAHTTSSPSSAGVPYDEGVVPLTAEVVYLDTSSSSTCSSISPSSSEVEESSGGSVEDDEEQEEEQEEEELGKQKKRRAVRKRGARRDSETREEVLICVDEEEQEWRSGGGGGRDARRAAPRGNSSEGNRASARGSHQATGIGVRSAAASCSAGSAHTGGVVSSGVVSASYSPGSEPVVASSEHDNELVNGYSDGEHEGEHGECLNGDSSRGCRGAHARFVSFKESSSPASSIACSTSPASHDGPNNEGTVMQHKTGSHPRSSQLYNHQQQQNFSGSNLENMASAHLRSALKRQGQRSRGHRVSFNESLNQFMEPDYVILFQGDSEPQLVSIRSLELGLPPPPGPPVLDNLTLSPPDGYKDCFNRALRISKQEDSDTESGVDGSVWPGEVHAPTCPRSNLPDVVASQRSRLTVENVRHHDQIILSDGHTTPVARTGILKYGKFWKNGDNSKKMQQEISGQNESHRRSVRFSGRDEYTMVDSCSIDEQAAITKLITPRLRELSLLLGKDPWQLDLGSIAGDPHHHHHHHHHDIPDPPPEPKSMPLDPSQLEDEHIGESMRRYEEMRRRLATGESRDGNSESSDESKSSNDSHSSDSTTTESRIRRLENADIAQVAGGILRSNSEVRRAIEQNALRRSLIKYSDARKKDTNKNERNEKRESSILEKLKWLTATEDLTNGNSDEKYEDTENEEQQKDEQMVEQPQEQRVEIIQDCRPVVENTAIQYRQLAEMFNKSTSSRGVEFKVPTDVREWKIETDLVPSGLVILENSDDDMRAAGATFTAVPAVSICEPTSDEEADKLLYSGGVRYTREGTLMPPRRKELYVNKILGKYGGRYTLNDIDEALHDDRSSSVPSSSQSSPRLSGRSEMDGTSTTESGYSSNETNGEFNAATSMDELAEFVKQDAGRLERLRMRYSEGDDQDHGFSRRPAVKGIKPRFGTTSEVMQQMTGQVIMATKTVQPNASNMHMTWPYREPSQDVASSGVQRNRTGNQPRSSGLPSVQEDITYQSENNCIEHISTTQDLCCHHDHASFPLGNQFPQNHQIQQQPILQCSTITQHETCGVRQHNVPVDQRSVIRFSNQDSHSHDHMSSQQIPNPAAIPPPPHYGSAQSLQTAVSRQHHPSCHVRRPNSLHEQLPSEVQVAKYSRPTNLGTRPHSSLGQYSNNRFSEENMQQQTQHQPLGPRGSFPGTSSMHGVTSPTQHQEAVMVGHRHQQSPQCSIQPKPNYPHSPQELMSPNQSSPVGSGVSFIGCYPRPQQPQRLPSNGASSSHARCYPPQWNPLSGGTVPVSSHLSYTTPIVPDSAEQQARKSHHEIVSKVDILRDERGVPEGASSSPRSSYDSQYHSHGSPSREQNLLLRQPPTLDIST